MIREVKQKLNETENKQMDQHTNKYHVFKHRKEARNKWRSEHETGTLRRLCTNLLDIVKCFNFFKITLRTWFNTTNH